MGVLAGKVAIVTGASSGIGRATALAFASAGAQVVLTARNGARLGELVREIEGTRGTAVALAGDVQTEAHGAALVDLAVKQYGGLDIGFNNVGAAGANTPVTELSLETWRTSIDTNLTSAFLGAKHQIPAMLERGGGSLIYTSTFVGLTVGMAGTTAYASSKAGLMGLVQSLAVEYGARGIRANALIPGGTDTPANFANVPGAGPEVRAYVEGLHALKRLAKPEEIALSALFLASDASSFTTGSALFADGGVSITR